jgi:hypothetical protein
VCIAGAVFIFACNKKNSSADEATSGEKAPAKAAVAANDAPQGGKINRPSLKSFATPGSKVEGASTGGAGNPNAGKGFDSPNFFSPNEAEGSKLSLNTYNSQFLNKAGEAIDFQCPGDSVFYGLTSTYEDKGADRRWLVTCAFYADAQGAWIRKTSCKDYPLTGSLRRDRSFNCPTGEVLAGMSSNFDGANKDRNWNFQCCNLSGAGNTPVTYSSDKCTNEVPQAATQVLSSFFFSMYRQDGLGSMGVNQEVNEYHQPLQFSCQLAVRYDPSQKDVQSAVTPVMGSMISGIKLTYGEGADDARFSFQCCQLDGPSSAKTSPMGL